MFGISPIDLISTKYIIGNMFENIAYVGLGFVAVFLGLELAWHYTDFTLTKICAYSIYGNTIFY
jgi:hypothetical protein